MEEESIASSSNSGLRQRKGAQYNGSQTETHSSVASDKAKLLSKSLLEKNLRPSASAHKKIRESPLSSDTIFQQSHAGLFNLCVVVLVAVNSRLIIENLMKYGLLIRAGFWFSSKSLREWPLLMCGLSLLVFPLLAFLIEKLKIRNLVSEKVAFVMYSAITTLAIAYPIYVIQRVHSALLSGIILLLFSVTGWMKLISYAHTNYDLRVLYLSGEKPEMPLDMKKVEYPESISLKNLAYFWVAPTLCYQVSYPRTEKIRKGWVLRQLIKLIIFTGLMGFIAEQYINPTIRNSQHPLKGNYLYAIERVLKLSIPTTYFWLCMFYCVFHLWLNIIAELTCFGDREFYKDWWNAKTVEEYWRMWNMPVHNWMLRHVYFPCLRQGITKEYAVVICFVFSGAVHEVCVGVPCHILRCWAFLGIMFQLPLVVLTKYVQKRFQSSVVGNMIFWFFFCIVGQPMCILLYYHDFINQEQGTMIKSQAKLNSQ
eukprot:c24184_g1_i1 orf=196-1641(+)